MKITRDMLAGGLFLGTGLVFAVAGRNYPIGTTRAMGAGYFPMLVACAVMLLGLITIVKSYLKDEGGLELNFGAKPFVLVLSSVLLFAVLISTAGIVPAVAATIVVSRLAAPKATILELFTLAAVGCAAIVAIFVYGLGIPLRLWI